LLTLLGDLGGVRALVCWEAGGQAETIAPPTSLAEPPGDVVGRQAATLTAQL
jgi:hypothetical protein